MNSPLIKSFGIVAGAALAVTLLLAPLASASATAVQSPPTASSPAASPPPASAKSQSVEVLLPNGSTWRGEVADRVDIVFAESSVEQTLTGTITKVDRLYLVFATTIAGRASDKVLFLRDIRSISASTAPAPAGERAGAKPAEGDAERVADPGSVFTSGQKGVFVLPLEGMVGIAFRYQEIEEIGKHADQYGPGQIIVLIIDSGGGLVIESEKISDALVELKKRHRVVAWIKEAISAAAYTALHCDEIYFMNVGSLGAITMFAGGVSIKGAELMAWLDRVGHIAQRHGNRFPAAIKAMVYSPIVVSYDKDPVTGRITWYESDQGEFILSKAGDNLTLNASNALHSGLSDGTADTTDELAKLLQLEEWHEISDYGRKIAARWQETSERAVREIRLLFSQFETRGTSTGDPEVILGNRMSVVRELIRWWDRAPNVCRYEVGLPPKEFLERQLREGERMMEQLRRQRRNR